MKSKRTIQFNVYPALGEDDQWIELFVCDLQFGAPISLFKICWNVSELNQWLIENKNHILNEKLPVFAPAASCIAESLAKFYDQDSDPTESQFETMYSYRTHHGLRFALLGANIPDIYIGVGTEGGQLSYMANGRPLHFSVELESAFNLNVKPSDL